MSQSRIEWTDRTWNVAVGCTRVSEGCRNCYAERQAVRHEGRAYKGVVRSTPQGPRWTGAVQLHEARLEEPLGWQRPARVFVCSMGDLFHEDVPDAFLDRVFAVMALCPQHQFQVLTKRPERARRYLGVWDAFWRGEGSEYVREALKDRWDAARAPLYTGLIQAGNVHRAEQVGVRLAEVRWPLPNVWLGTSVEDQATAEARVPHLLDTPAAVRFLSYEPALGPVELMPWLAPECVECARPVVAGNGDEKGRWCGVCGREGYQAVDWVIAGGESGPGARPPHPEWFRDVRDECAEAGVAFFFKQWGAYEFTVSGSDMQDYVAYEADDEDLRDNAERCQIVVQDGGRTAGPELARREWWAGVSLDVDDAVMRRVGKKAAGRLLDGREHSEWPEVST